MLTKTNWLLTLWCFVLILSCTLLFSGSVSAGKGAAYNATQDYIDDVMQVFIDYDICAQDKIDSEKQEALRQDLSRMAGKIFDYDYMCRKAVGPYWRVFTDEQRKQTVSLFTELLETNYFGELIEYLQDVDNLCRQNIQVVGQEMLSSDKALVKSIIVYEDSKYPVNYVMRENQGEWQIYNVVIEGVSLIENYSSQFRDILGRNNPEAFIKQLKDKVEQKK